MTTEIVYFSGTNNTKTAAEYLAGKIDAKLTRIEGKGSPASLLFGMLHIPSVPMGDPWTAVAECDRLILMSPIYAFNGVAEVCGFLSQADLQGKSVLVILNGSGPDGALPQRVYAQYVKLIEKAGGTVTGPRLYHVGGEYKKFAGEETLHAQVDGIFDLIAAWLAS